METFKRPEEPSSVLTPQLSQPMFETWLAGDGTVITIRPISAADLALEQEFVNALNKAARLIWESAGSAAPQYADKL